MVRTTYKTLLCCAFIISLQISTAHSAELNALQLQQYCHEIEKGLLGKKFNEHQAQICEGYVKGFFDSIVIIAQVTRKQQICIPKSLPKTQNNVLLNAWVQKHKSIAAKTTAAVALFAAYSKTFPCK